MKPISNRYVQEETILSLERGRLYKGRDLSLNRTVFIYMVPHQGKAYAQAYLHKIGTSAQVTNHAAYMHVFDVEIDDEFVYVIMKYIEGRSLQQLLQQKFTYEEAAEFVCRIGQALTEIAVERPLSFSIKSSNLWVGDSGQITLINTWDAAAQNSPLSKELGGLLYRLLMRTERLPENVEDMRASLKTYLPDELTENQRKAVIAAVTAVYAERLSAPAFIQFLKEGPSDTDTDTAEWKRSYLSGLSYEKEEAAAADSPARRSPGLLGRTLLNKRIWKRLSIALSLGALSLTVFIGVFALLIESNGQKKNEFRSSAAPVNSTQPPPQPSEPQRPEESRAVKLPADATEGTESPVNIPTLTGLTKEAAEQQALASGLRYTYYLEMNPQAAGTVFKQEPAPNEQAAKGSRVIFWISKGSPAP
jgi:hypothetical protein